MTALVLFFFFCQALGAAIGVAASLWGEMSYMSAMWKGQKDIAERAYLRIIGSGMRYGLGLSLLASLFLVILAYVFNTSPQPALTASYWMFIAFAFLIIISAWAIVRKHVSFALGSAATLTAWWLLAYLTLGRLPVFSFGSAIALYVILTAIVYAVLRYVRFLALDSAMKHRLPKP